MNALLQLIWENPRAFAPGDLPNWAQEYWVLAMEEVDRKAA